jgi:hypothetical protein
MASEPNDGGEGLFEATASESRAKIKSGSLNTLPLDDNPFADWSAHLFLAGRVQYILLTNTRSLYSVFLFGKGITHDGQFIERALSNIREFMEADGLEFVYHRFIIPATVRFVLPKPLTAPSRNQ